MKTKFKPDEIIKPAAVLFAICVLVTAILAATNKLTADKIAQLAEQKATAARMELLPIADSFEQISDDVYRGVGMENATVGYVITTVSKGYGGDVEVMTGILADGNVCGVKILSHNETPGLGANAGNESFLSQYSKAPQPSYSVTKDGGTIDAVTGATITSRAVTNAVNDALTIFAQQEGGK